MGDGRNIEISAGSLEVLNGAQIQASTAGRGNAGNVIIKADEQVVFDGIGVDELPSAAFSRVEEGAIGSGGSITIDTNSLIVRNGAPLSASTRGQGNAGNVIIKADDRVVFDNSTVFSTVERGAVGDGRNIEITTGSLEVLNGAQLRASTAGRGNAGNVIITADKQVLFDGIGVDEFSSAAFSRVEEGAIGSGGNISIDTNSLIVRNGARLSASTRGQGNAGNVIINAIDRVVFDDGTALSSVEEGGIGSGGNIRIDTGSLEVRDGAQLVASTAGRGNAGNVTINANDRVVFDDGTALSSVEEGGIGSGGNINIDTGSLALRNGAQLAAFTRGQGDAGSVIINATDRVVFDGTGADGLPSAAFARVGEAGVGRGGNIRIDTNSLIVRNGAQLTASTAGQGDAGDVTINAIDRVVFDDGTALSSVEEGGIGSGGNIRIDTGSLEVRDGAQLVANTRGQGRAGNVSINADNQVSIERIGNDGRSSGLFAATFSEARGQGGDITIAANSIRIADGAVVNAETESAFRGGDVVVNADTFEITGGGQIITTTSDRGRAGNITLNATDRITLSGFDPDYDDRLNRFGTRVSNQGETSGLFANATDNSSSRGGTIRITTGEFNVSDRGGVVANSQGRGAAGNIDASAQLVQLDRGRLTAEAITADDGGNIALRDLELLLLRNGSLISTTAGTDLTGGNGGNITIDADLIVAAPNENSDIRANAFTGEGANVVITTEGLLGIEPRDQLTDFSDITTSSEQGVQGDINNFPIQGLTELPTEVVDASDQIAQTCPTDGNIAEEVGEFVVTGRGGLPANPAELLSGETVLTELAEVGDTAGEAQGDREAREPNRVSAAINPEPEIMEAQGWVVGADGRVALVAETAGVEPHSPNLTPVHCPKS